MLANDGAPCGYVLGTRDTAAFAARCEAEWFPVLRERYPLPADDDRSDDAHMIRMIHRGVGSDPDLTEYPAHLHIDLLPEAQGQGQGRMLMHALLEHLRALHVPGVHLGTGAANQRAVAFYDRVGFQRLRQNEHHILFGMRLR